MSEWKIVKEPYGYIVLHYACIKDGAETLAGLLGIQCWLCKKPIPKEYIRKLRFLRKLDKL